MCGIRRHPPLDGGWHGGPDTIPQTGLETRQACLAQIQLIDRNAQIYGCRVEYWMGDQELDRVLADFPTKARSNLRWLAAQRYDKILGFVEHRCFQRLGHRQWILVGITV